MATTIGTSNLIADRVRLNLGRLDNDLSKVTERLSTGLNIPLDTPGDTGVGAQFEIEIRGLRAAGVNIQTGGSMLNIADAALSQISDMLGSMFELAVQAANGSLNDTDRVPIDAEFQQSKANINTLASTTRYKATVLLDGTGGTVTLQAGTGAGQTVSLDFTTDFSTAGVLNGLAGLDLTTQANAQTAVANLPGIQGSFSASRASTVGRSAALSALSFVNGQAQVEAVASKSAYVDADIAQEASNLVRDQLRQTAGAAALQVANFSASAVVNLLSSVANRAASH